jgi:hypothetical protein
MTSALFFLALPFMLGPFAFTHKGHLFLDVPRYIHSLMQNTGDINGVVSDPINDDMTTRWKKTVRSRKFGSGMTDLRILLNGQKRLIENSPIGVSLCFAPRIEGVLQNVGKVILGLRREN